MAFGKISGPMLQPDLARQGVDLSVDTNLTYFDVTNRRVGINTAAPTKTLDVNGNVKLGNILITSATISSDTGKIDLGAPANISLSGGTSYDVLITDGAGNLSFANLNVISGLDSFTGNNIFLGTPLDSSLTANSAYSKWTTTTKVTDALDNLNQVALNIAQNTFVGNVQFTANSVAGASPKLILFTGTYAGQANVHYWDFGDGNTFVSSTSTVAHTYNNTLGGQYTVTYRASNSSGTWGGNATLGATGSVDDFTRTNYITLYTPNPIPGFTANTVYLNTGGVLLFTDTSTYETDYTVYWGDGTTTISSNTAPRTQKHTYTNTIGDTQYSIILQANSTTAGPYPPAVSVNSAVTTANVFSTHTPVLTANVPYVINWEANGGGIVNFTNGTTTNPGNAAVFGSGQRYNYWWSDSTANANVQIGSGGATSGSYQNQTLSHVYTMSSAQQSAGANVTYSTQLQVYNGHSTSPFVSSNVSIVVVPSVRSNISATAVTVSDKTGDTALTGYVYTDYNGNNRALFTYNTAAQNTTTYNWGWGDGAASGNITTGAGTTSANITYTYTSTGAKTANLTVWGAPNTISQSNSKSVAITINSNPTAPGALSTKTLSLSSASQYTNAPLIAANAVDNTSGNIASPGSSVTRYTSINPVVTNTITQANTSVAGTLTAYVNTANLGGVGFSNTTNASGTYTSLIVDADADAHTAISAATYPTGFYKVFSAHTSTALSSFGLGYNDIHLSHTTGGSTNNVGLVKDDVTSVPTLVTSGVSMSNVSTAGATIRYISGIPYYQSGGNVRVIGLQAYNWIGQTYTSATPMSIAANATVAEGTTGTIVSAQTRTYAQLDGATTYLSGGIPKANTGNVIANTYTFGNIFVNVDGTAAAVGSISATLTSVNGASTAVSLPSLINVYSSAYTGFDETNIVCSAGAAAGNTTPAKRVVISSANISTPIYANTGTNYYSSAAFTSTSTVTGTTEAVVRWGNLRVNTTNYSTGYLPVGPDLSIGANRTTTQSFKFAFQRPIMQNMKVVLTGRVAGMYVAVPGTRLTDTNSTLNGWMDATVAYAGSGYPGANTSAGGNGSTGCAVGTTVPTSTFVSNVAYILTLGSGDLSQSTSTGGYNQCLFNIVLGPNDWVSNVYLGSY
jgi:hypothetical protein